VRDRATIAAEAKRVRDAVNAAEANRRRDYAIGKAKCELWFMINRLHLEEKNPAEAAYYHALDRTLRILNDPDADKLVRKYACAADARDKITDARNKIISFLQTGRPPLRPKQGRRTDTLRNRWIADIIEGIRLLGVDVSRGDATRDNEQKSATRQSACSIVATVWAELKSELEKDQGLRAILIDENHFTPLLADLQIEGLRAELSYGLRKGAKGLSERQLKRIYDKSQWAKRAQSQRRNRY
jgi:hypothetical protein